jgi:hypothetical protein
MELVAHIDTKSAYWKMEFEFIHDGSYDGNCSICKQSMKHLELLLDYMHNAHLFKLGTELPESIPSNRTIFLKEVTPLGLVNWMIDTFNDSFKTAHVKTIIVKHNHGQTIQIDVT